VFFLEKKPALGTLIIKRIQTKNGNIIHKCLKGLKCQHYTLVVKDVQIIHKWLKGK